MIVNFNSEFEEDKKINPFVSRYKVFIAYPCVANGYNFSHDSLDSETMKMTVPNSPVVAGFVEPDGKKLGGHTGNVIASPLGLKRTPQVQAIGFTESCEPWWEDHKGNQWLTTYADVWTNYFDGLSNLNDRLPHIAQSMECDMDLDSKNNVKDCALHALCMLENVQPAFKDAGFESVNFSKDDFNSQVNELKNELTDFEKYNSLNFNIPDDIKSNLNTSNQVTSVCKEHINCLFSNNYITPKEVISLHKYFSRCNEKSKEYLGGSKCENWVNTLIDNMSKIDRGDKMAEFSKEDIASGDYEIKVVKDKDKVSNKAWGDVDKTALMNKVIKAKNAESVVKSVYLRVDDDWKDHPSEGLHDPVMEVNSDNEAVYNAGGLLSAEQYESHDNGNAEVAKKAHSLREKLGLIKEDKKGTSKGGDKGKMSKKFNKQAKEEYVQKFSMTVSQIMDAMNDAVSTQTFDTDDGTRTKYSVWDFDDTYMYGYDSENHNNCAIPYSITTDGITPDFANVKKAKQISLWAVEDDDGYDDADDDDTPSLFAKAKDEMMSKKLIDAQAETGKKFAEVTSLETALADEKKANEERQKQIDDLSKQLKTSKDNENMSKAKDLLNKKEFSVFTKDIKDKMLENDSVNSFDKFETFAYAELGKFTSTHLDYDENNAKFSFMYIPESTTTPETAVKEDDVYTEIKKKHNNKK